MNDDAPERRDVRGAARLLGILALPLVVADQVTKYLALRHLTTGVSRPVVGNVLRLSLTFNTGAPMGIPVGSHGRVVMGCLAFIVLCVLLVLLLRSPRSARVLRVCLAVVVAGAVGNLIDRVARPAGVVDFIDAGIGVHRFWSFNVADSCVTCGAIALIVLLGRSGPREPGSAAAPSSGASQPGRIV